MTTGAKQSHKSPTHRKKTDKSLRAERAKTDGALAKERLQAEQNADEAVSSNRAEADESRAKSRRRADSVGGGGGRLEQERKMTDAALDVEREHGDAVLELEREQKKAQLNKLFYAERQETDEDLTSERQQTDVEVQRAVAALTSRDEFLAIVTHDLRNPLGSIAMAAEMLAASPSFAGVSARDRDYVEVIDRSAREALRLIGDLLDMERLSAGKFNLLVNQHDVKPIVMHAVKALEPQVRSKRLTTEVQLPDTALMAPCDRDRVSQLLSNLLGNAIKFTPPEGVITVSAKKISGAVEVTVADTGPGIPKDMHQSIFERLGLYISKMIAEAHRGRIWVDSDGCKGSAFHFTLKT